VSEINGQKITRADLEKAQGNKLLQARYQYYQAELKALDEFIENRLLQDEARKRNMSVDELLDKEVVSKIQNPTDEQLQFFYDDLNVKDSFANLRDKIFDHVRQRRIAKQRAAFIESIRTKSEVLITLAPPSADFPLEGAPRLGPENAPVRLVEFADYQCPYCAKVNPHIAKLREEFGDKVSVYFKDLPLQMHANARKAAEAARCAGDQNKFWEFHDQLFRSAQLEVPQLKQQARDLKLDADKFDKCLDEGTQAAAVQKDLTDAQQLGLSGTPAFFLNGQYFSGAVDYNTIRDMVNQQLTKVQRASN
jgi:predicted DsbA family dithiol-disulfide isomerase